MNRRWAFALGVVWSATAVLSGTSSAKDVKLAVPEFAARDPFIVEFDADKGLAKSGINIAVTPVSSSLAALQALLKGQADLALFTLEAFNELQPTDRPALSRLILQPFQFESNEELFSVQKTAFGEAILAEVNRANLFPLTFWNQGLSRIVTRPEVKSIEDFRGLTIGAPSSAAADVLERLGATWSVLPGRDLQKAMQDGKINGLEVPSVRATPEFVKAVSGYSIVPGIRPMVGVLAASFSFWEDLNEANKQLLVRASLIAAEKGRAFVLEIERKEKKKFSEMHQVLYTQFDANAKKRLHEIAVRAYIETQAKKQPQRQLDALDEAKTFAQRDGSKKKTFDNSSPVNSANTLARTPIYFATDRNDEQHSDIKNRFGTKRLDRPRLICGKLDYSTVLGRNSGSPFTGDIGIIRDSERTGFKDCALFFRRSIVSGSALLIFIHGYNSSFDDAVRRAIGLAEDISLKGAVLVWSWPSNGSLFSYTYDGVSSQWSAAHFSELLSELLSGQRYPTVDIISHSMGARIALDGLERGVRDSRAAIRSFVFVAPDEDRTVFEQRIRRIRGASRTAVYADATLYGSVHDRAIKVSEWFHWGPRAGSGGSDLLVMEGVESIDTSPLLPYNFFGHGYAFEHRRVMDDLRLLLIDRIRPSDARRRLFGETNNLVPYWKLRD